MSTKRVKLSVFAKQQGISYITAYRHWNLGNIEGTQLPSGSILVSDWVDQNVKETNTAGQPTAIIYSRVSFSNQKQQLQQQTQTITQFAEERNYDIIDTVEEISAGFSDHRMKLLSILYRTDWNILIVQDRDTFIKFGFPYIEAVLRRNGQEIVCYNDYNNFSDENTDTLTTNRTGEQELITLIQKTKNLMKTLIGIGSTKSTIEKSINNILN